METLTYIGEIWRPVKGYEGLYEVSNKGRVRSLHGGRIRILKPNPNKKGYMRINLFKGGNGKHKMYEVHRLVAIAFLPNPFNLPCINHKDENTSNNCVENLEWCTKKYNSRYGTVRQRIGEKNRNGALSKKVYQYSQTGELIAIFPSINEVKRQTGYADSNICNCCNGKRKNGLAYGYVWRYEEWKKL